MKGLLSNAPLFFPSAREWMWSYCIYLGPFTNSAGDNFDLGVCISEHEINNPSAAIVYSDTPGDYYSGDLNSFGLDKAVVHSEIYEETRKRAAAMGIYNYKHFKGMYFEIQDKDVIMMDHLMIHGTKISHITPPKGLSKEEFVQGLMEMGLIYEMVENTETGRKALHLTTIGREACARLNKTH